MLMRTKVVVWDFLVNNLYPSLVFGDKKVRTCNASLTGGSEVTSCHFSAVGKREWLVPSATNICLQPWFLLN